MIKDQISKLLKTILITEGRNLSHPDGRALYAYRLNQEEVNALKDQLSKCIVDSFSGTDWVRGAERIFVLYAAEWWRSNYDGGPWRWKDVFISIGWPVLSASQRRLLVEQGLSFWKRKIHRQASDRNDYLMTLVTEGGFPVKLVERPESHLKIFLKSMLTDYSLYVNAGMSVERIAESHAHRLPRSFRHPAVYQLAADLTVSIYELSEQTQDSPNPFETLNQQDVNWRDKLPISLDSNSAQTLVNSLLRTAAKRRSIKYEQLTLTRYFTRDLDGNFRHQAKVNLPSSLTVALLAEEVGIPADKLPRRLEMSVYVDGKIRRVATLSKEGEEYFVYPGGPESLLLEISPTSSVSAMLVDPSGARLNTQDLRIVGGSALDEDLPLVCYEDNEQFIIVGQGGIQSRLDYLFVSLPEGLRVIDGAEEAIPLDMVVVDFHANGRWLKIDQPLVIDLQGQFSCTIKPGHAVDNNPLFIARGNREYLFEGGSKLPIFRGFPKFHKSTNGQLTLAKVEDVYWSLPNSKEWVACSCDLPKGTVKVRIVEGDECVFSTKLTVLPSDFSFSLQAGSDPRSGEIIIEGLDGAVFATQKDVPVELLTSSSSGTTVISCKSTVGFSGKMPLLLRWPSGEECQLLVPFPAQGSHFVDTNGADLGTRVVALNDLVSISAVGISPNEYESFTIQGELRANDIGKNISRSTFGFRKKMAHVSTGYSEFRLVDLYTKIRDLFSYSADLDAKVSLEILQDSRPTSRLDISQFDSELIFDHSNYQLCHFGLDGKPSDERVAVNFIPMVGDEALDVDTAILTQEGGFGWQLNQNLPGELYLAVAKGSSIRSIRPCVVFSKVVAEVDHEEGARQLEDIFQLSHPGERRRALTQLVIELVEDPSDSRWSSVLINVRKFAEVHPDSIDLYEAIIDNAAMAAGVLIRSTENDLTALMDWENFLPFRWWQVPIKDYVQAYSGYANFVISEYPDYQELMLDTATNALVNLRSSLPITGITIDAALLELLDRKPSGFLVNAEKIGPQKLFEVLNEDLKNELMIQIGDEQWPTGISREEWDKLFEEDLPWLNDGRMGFRKPLLDAIVAVAYSIAVGFYLPREERAFVCAMRAFNSKQFDRMLKFAESAIYLTRL